MAFSLSAVAALWATEMMTQKESPVALQRAQKEVEQQQAAETKSAAAHSWAQEVDQREVRQSEEVVHFLSPAQYLAPA